ncbi:MAG: hypothetical protein ACR2FS_15260 [Phormidesmis sp.]
MSILKRQGELNDVDGLLLPKYGALKVGEVLAFNEFVQQWPTTRKGLSDGQADIEAALQNITILLRRLDPDWTIENTRGQQWTLPMDGKVGGKTETFEPDSMFTEALYKFFQGELRRWPDEEDAEKAETEAESPGKEQTGTKSTGDSAKAIPAAKRSRASKAS